MRQSNRYAIRIRWHHNFRYSKFVGLRGIAITLSDSHTNDRLIIFIRNTNRYHPLTIAGSRDIEKKNDAEKNEPIHKII